MSAVAPVISWTGIAVPGVFSWEVYRQPGDPPAVVSGLDHASTTGAARAILNASTSGGVQLSKAGTFTLGSRVVTNVPDATGIVAGQELVDPSGIYLPQYPTAYVTGGNSSEVVFTFDDLAYSGDGPLASSPGNVGFIIRDPAPVGTLAVVVSPGSGVTITDQNADGSGWVDYTGDGSAICNLLGQAVGNVELLFTAAGTYTVTFQFETSDPNYAAVTLSPSVQFEVA